MSIRQPRLLSAAVVAALVLGCGRGEGAGEGSATTEDRVAAPAALAPGTAPPPRVDNVLLITVDTLRADALGFAGNPRAATPALDRLAAGGRVFRRAHAHNVMTLPSHANILTGLLPYQHGVRDNVGFRLPESVPTLATLLRSAGFATAAVVSAFPLDARFGLANGFAVYDDSYPEGTQTADFAPPERAGGEVVRAGLSWWRQNDGRRRLLWLHLFEPHAPYAPPEPYAGRFADDPYLGEVAAVDAYLAPLLEAFLEGREAPTLVVFTSDHGEGLGEHGERTHGLFAYEATLAVPLVLWAPGLDPGDDETPARHVDLLPTALAATGVPAPPDLPGRSLFAPAGGGPTGTYFEALSAQLNRGWAPLRGVLHDGLKLISLPVPELYDLAADPREEHNLFPSRRDEARRLAALLPEEPAAAPARREPSAEEAARLRGLGYLSGSAPKRSTYTAADDPKNLVALDGKVHRFIDLYQAGRLDEAVELARRIVAERPSMGVGHYHLAQALLELGRVGEAVEVMARARAEGVATPALLRQLGLSLAQLGRTADALAILEPLVPDGDPDLLNAYAVALSEAGRQAEARAQLERVFERDPRNPTAHQNLALVALRSQDWAEAGRQAEAALALNERLPLCWNYLGAARYNLGRPRPALEAWERALVLDPGNYDVLYNVAFIAAEVGESGRAREALERFVASAPADRYGTDIARARALLARMKP